MINSISLENFKCFKEKVTLPISNLTLLSGLNSCGKSSLYQALLLLQQSEYCILEYGDNLIPYLKLNGSIVQLGKPEEIINDLSKHTIFVSLNFDDRSKIENTYILDDNISLKKNLKYNIKPTLLLKKSVLKFGEGKYEFLRNDNSNNIKASSALYFEDSIFEEHLFNYIQEKCIENNIEIRREFYLSSIVEFENITSVFFYQNIIRSFLVNISDATNCLAENYRELFKAEEFNSYLKKKDYKKKVFELKLNEFTKAIRTFNFEKNIIFIPPFRGYPKRIYIETEDPNPMSYLDEHLNDIIKYEIVNNEVKENTLSAALNYWIPKILNIDQEFKINSIVNGLVSETVFIINNREIAINNVGFGISQILPMIVKVLASAEGSFCIVDEPEVHLHPAVQSKIADFFYTMSKLNKKILIETHSEYIINKINYFKMIDKSKEINLYWIIKNEGESEIVKIETDTLGYIINPPQGFLDENNIITELLSEERCKRI